MFLQSKQVHLLLQSRLSFLHPQCLHPQGGTTVPPDAQVPSGSPPAAETPASSSLGVLAEMYLPLGLVTSVIAETGTSWILEHLKPTRLAHRGTSVEELSSAIRLAHRGTSVEELSSPTHP